MKKEDYDRVKIVNEQIKVLKKNKNNENHLDYEIKLSIKEKESFNIIHTRLYNLFHLEN